MISLMVADDEEIVRTFIRTVIEKERLPVKQILEADNGLETVRLAREHKPDLVLLDIRMPGLGGLQACAAIRRDLPDTEVVIVSAYDEFGYARQAFTSGARDYLLKPVSHQQVVELINRSCLGRGPSRPESAAPPHPLLDGVRRYVEDNLERDIKLADLARTLFVSPSHLSRKFKKLAGEPVSLFIQRLRVTRAVELMADPGLSITDIAGMVGFNDPGYFATCFKAQTGRTPTQYRQQSGLSAGPED